MIVEKSYELAISYIKHSPGQPCASTSIQAEQALGNLTFLLSTDPVLLYKNMCCLNNNAVPLSVQCKSPTPIYYTNHTAECTEACQIGILSIEPHLGNLTQIQLSGELDVC